MRVLIAPMHFYLNPSYGSEVSWAYNIVLRLAKNFNVQIDAACGKTENVTLPPNVRIFEVGFSKGDLVSRGLFYFRCYSKAKKFYENADLVHHMFPFGFTAGFNLLAVFGDLRNKPLIIGPIQYPQEYSDITEYMWLSGKKGIRAKLSYTLENIMFKCILETVNLLHKTTLRRANTLVFDSEKTLRLYRKMYPDILKGKILEAIPPGVEIEMFRYAPPVEKDYFEILTAGYILKRKGIQYLIEAMPAILEEFRNVRLRIVGDGPYKWKLEKLVEKLSLSNVVSFEGRVPRSKMVDYYVNCDIYVQASLSEAFPSAIEEAMAVGRPIIVTDVGVVAEYIKDGVNGFLVQPRDTRELAYKIIRLISDEQLRTKIGKEARKFVEKKLDWEIIVKEWYKFYCKLV